MSDYAQECLSPCQRNPSMGVAPALNEPRFAINHDAIPDVYALGARLRDLVRAHLGFHAVRCDPGAQVSLRFSRDGRPIEKFRCLAWWGNRSFEADGTTPLEALAAFREDALPKLCVAAGVALPVREFDPIALGA